MEKHANECDGKAFEDPYSEYMSKAAKEDPGSRSGCTEFGRDDIEREDPQVHDNSIRYRLASTRPVIIPKGQSALSERGNLGIHEADRIQQGCDSMQLCMEDTSVTRVSKQNIQ